MYHFHHFSPRIFLNNREQPTEDHTGISLRLQRREFKARGYANLKSYSQKSSRYFWRWSWVHTCKCRAAAAELNNEHAAIVMEIKSLGSTRMQGTLLRAHSGPPSAPLPDHKHPFGTQWRITCFQQSNELRSRACMNCAIFFLPNRSCCISCMAPHRKATTDGHQSLLNRTTKASRKSRKKAKWQLEEAAQTLATQQVLGSGTEWTLANSSTSAKYSSMSASLASLTR